jgi:SAM-dependent methyltransferase
MEYSLQAAQGPGRLKPELRTPVMGSMLPIFLIAEMWRQIHARYSVWSFLTIRFDRQPGGAAPMMFVRVKMKNVLRAIKQMWGTTKIKRELWNREYAAGRWDHCENASGDPVYDYVEKYCMNGSVLDLGCGSGNTGSELDTKKYDCYTGVDVSDEALRKGTARSEGNGRDGKNRYVQADILTYVPSERYNVILFRESVYYVPRGRIKAMLDRYSRYLKDDGVFVVVISKGGTNDFTEIVSLIETHYGVVEKHSDGFILVFR